ncbi:MAG: hypothetical protein DDT26_02723 [Dehalococcoidia bacterium]|nr:hypothetical protein [Chloroflexota bacterium]
MSTSATAKRTRAIAHPGNQTAKMRAEMYRAAYARINEATKAGYHLEAITIIESIVADRLESRLTHVMGKDFSFQHLGSLITKARQVEKDLILLPLIDQDLDNWRIARNKALHEMAKIATGDTTTWADRVADLVPISKDGLALLRKIDKQIKALR